jgi:two-component system, chemotaxis family, chemotaxis protein CheY
MARHIRSPPLADSMPDPSVLIVEDDEEALAMMNQFLQLEGFATITARNGREALHVLRSAARPCVILLDLMMPVMDGWQFRQVQREDAALAAIPVIVVSAAGSRERRATLDPVEYIPKPIDLERLLGSIQRYCR